MSSAGPQAKVTAVVRDFVEVSGSQGVVYASDIPGSYYGLLWNHMKNGPAVQLMLKIGHDTILGFCVCFMQFVCSGWMAAIHFD